jgi:muconolactone delta-isomerase
MAGFMVVCRFADGTAMEEVFAVVAEEQAQVAVLEAEGRVGAIHLSLARGTVFIETFADDAEGAADTVRTLPMARWWDLDVYPLGAPAVPGAAA